MEYGPPRESARWAHSQPDRSSSGWTARRSPPRRWSWTRTTGAVIARGQAPHTVSGGDGPRERPGRWWRALGEALAQCGDAARQASALSVGGQQHGLVALDAAGRAGAPRPAVERRAPGAAERAADRGAGRREGLGPAGRQRAGARRSRWPSGPGCGRTSRPSAAATAAVRLPHDYLTERLTGAGRHRSRRRLGHRMVGVVHRVLRRGDPGARRADPRGAAAGGAHRARPPGTVHADDLPLPAWRAGGRRAPATTWRPRSGWACVPGSRC